MHAVDFHLEFLWLSRYSENISIFPSLFSILKKRAGELAASEISHDEFARAEKLPAVKMMPLPSEESDAGFPFTSTSRTFPFPSEQADCSFAEKSEKEDCESDVSRRDCALEARRELAA